MFSKFATFVVVALGALSVSATEFSCNTGAVQCCDSLQAPAEYSAEGIAALVGVAVSTITGQVGLGCDALTVIGASTGANWYVVSLSW